MKGNFPIPNIFSDIKGLVFAFSSSLDGDMRDRKVRDQFVRARIPGSWALVTMDQVHKARVSDVSDVWQTKEVSQTDGVARIFQKNETPVFLGVRVADCVPIFAVDPKTKIFGVAHAGWKGVLSKITLSLLSKMISLGSDKSTIRLFIGPHICTSCYRIGKDRAARFTLAYDIPVVRNTDSDYFLDLAKAIRLDALSMGIPEDHMEASQICSSCGRWPSFSYRKSEGKLEGEMMGILGFV